VALPKRTRTKTLTGRYGAALYKRWQRVIDLIKKTVIENNALELPLSVQTRRRLRRQVARQADTTSDMTETLAEPRDAFPFDKWGDRRDAFLGWLEPAIADEVLAPTGPEGRRRGDHHTAKWVRSAYRSGYRDAGTRLREHGLDPERGRDEIDAAIRLPASKRRLEQLYARQYEQLDAVTEDTAQAIREELTLAAARGENPILDPMQADGEIQRNVAARIADRVDAIGITRSRTIARTESAHSYNVASKTRFRENGIEQVEIINTTPCEICDPIVENGPYPIDDIPRGGPPLHPNCEGALSPGIDSAT
jgi:hypothetical protein